MTSVSIAMDENNVSHAIYSSLIEIDVESMIRNKEVAIKVNDTWASPTDTTAVTQPDTLASAIQYVKKFDPKHIVVTGGSGAGETDEIFKIAGLMEVVERENVEFFDHNRPPFTEVRLDYSPDDHVSGLQKSVMVNPRVLTYESLIVLSQLKVHETATVTLAMKNIAMSFPAADYYGHPRGRERTPHHFFEDMHSFIAAMAKRFPISLAITTTHPAMIGQGPIGGKTVEAGLVIASRDPLAADVVGARILGFNPEAVRQLSLASRLNVGEMNTDNMSFPILSLREAVRIFSRKAYGKEINVDHA